MAPPRARAALAFGALLLGCAGLPSPAPSEDPAAAPDAQVPRHGPPKRADRCDGRKALKTILEVAIDGTSYDVQAYVPPGSGPVNGMILLHGGGGDARKILRQTDGLRRAREHGFALLVPEGAPQGAFGPRWNTGKAETMPNERDDVAFLDEVARIAREELCVDRLLAFGFSNGSQMAQRWACESPEVDAIATVAGSLYVPPERCGVGVPIWTMAGERDPTLDMDKRKKRGRKKRSDREVPDGIPDGEARSFEDNVELYLDRNGCQRQDPKVERMGQTLCRTYACEHRVTACVVEGMAHKLPTERSEFGTDAPEDAWSWFVELPEGKRRK